MRDIFAVFLSSSTRENTWNQTGVALLVLLLVPHWTLQAECTKLPLGVTHSTPSWAADKLRSFQAWAVVRDIEGHREAGILHKAISLRDHKSGVHPNLVTEAMRSLLTGGLAHVYIHIYIYIHID